MVLFDDVAIDDERTIWKLGDSIVVVFVSFSFEWGVVVHHAVKGAGGDTEAEAGCS